MHPETPASGISLLPRAEWAAHRVRRRLAWMLLPLVAFVGLEIAMRLLLPELWYRGALARREKAPVDIVFIGRSVTQRAVNERILEQELSEALGRPVRVRDFARGYSTMTEHWLGLRNLYEDRHETYSNTLVIAPLYAGIPEYTSWSERWDSPAAPGFLLQVMRPGDIPRQFDADVPFAERMRITLAVSCSGLRLVRQRAAFRSVLDSRLSQLAAMLTHDKAPTIDPEMPEDEPVDDSESNAAQVRLRTAELSRTDWPELGEKEWRDSVQWSIVELVRAQGGEIAFLDYPMHQLMRDSLNQGDALASGHSFHELAAAEGIELLEASDFEFQDSDFPDYMHLDRRLCDEYTRAVARTLAPVLARHHAASSALP